MRACGSAGKRRDDRARIAELERINADQARTIRALLEQPPALRTPPAPVKPAASKWAGIPSGIEIYTDGSCWKNPGGPGGWGFVVVLAGKEIHAEHSDRYPSTTSNRMEMSGILWALQWLRQKGYADATIFSDSQLALNVTTGKWRAKKNMDLVDALRLAKDGLNVKFEWVRGHSGNRWNELADALAGTAAGPRPSERPRARLRNADSNTHLPGGKRKARSERGTFGPASNVRRINPEDYSEAS